MSNIRDQALATTSILTQGIPFGAEFDRTPAPDELKLAPPKAPVIFYSTQEAYQALWHNRRELQNHRNRTIGERFERNASHVAYAWLPTKRKENGKWIYGDVSLHVLHATKGWKIVHGARQLLKDVIKTRQEVNMPIGILSEGSHA